MPLFPSQSLALLSSEPLCFTRREWKTWDGCSNCSTPPPSKHLILPGSMVYGCYEDLSCVVYSALGREGKKILWSTWTSWTFQFNLNIPAHMWCCIVVTFLKWAVFCHLNQKIYPGPSTPPRRLMPACYVTTRLFFSIYSWFPLWVCVLMYTMK